MKKTTILWVLLIILIPSQAIRCEASEVDKTRYFQVDTENQWVEIPVQAISSYSEQVRKQTGSNVNYLAGYANTSQSRKNWFELPFILVTSDEKGKYPQEKLDEIVSKFNEGKPESLESLKDVLPPTQLGKMSYEKDRAIIWMEVVSDVPRLGKVHAITAMMLTKMGTLNFMLYVTALDRETQLMRFSTLLNRVRLNPDVIYRSEPEHSRPRSLTDSAGRGALKVIIIVLIIFVIGSAYKVISRVISKKKENPPKVDD